ncbi:MAG: 4-(cytidine 5'-diphospho)-2-C-methyl-D-erythritol kinase [Acidimicrobiales bacterium]
MIELTAPAKLTVSLRITGVRADGMHLIDAEMVSLDLCDRLVVEEGGSGVKVDGHDVGPESDNLVRRALDLADVQAGVTVYKAIPPGAGLGGGSADAAAVLAWAGWTDPTSAAAIGADVAFCLSGGRARVSGIGEQIQPLAFEDRTFTLLTPPFGCSTPAVYRQWDDMGGPVGDHGNDLEPAALVVAPELARFRDELAEVSGHRPRLAGSGSTWFVEGAFAGADRVVVRTVRARPPG